MMAEYDRGWNTPARNAWQKARKLEETTLVAWSKKDRAWSVPSTSTPGKWYLVWIDQSIPSHRPWWERLLCSCPAGEANRMACWHRARVALHWRREEERSYRPPS